MLSKLYSYLTLRDYTSANELATKTIIKRFTRGNISLKNGLYLTQRDVDSLSSEGDQATARLQKKVAA